jgi:hypothetical protein
VFVDQTVALVRGRPDQRRPPRSVIVRDRDGSSVPGTLTGPTS